MKMKKKLVSLLATTTMLASLITTMPVSVSAATTEVDPLFGVYTVANGTFDYSVKAVTDEVKGGERALHANIPTEVSNTNLAVKVGFNKEMVSGNTYKISLWVKCTNPGDGCNVRLYKNDGGYKAIHSSLTGVEGEHSNYTYGWNWRNAGFWVKYELDYTADANYNSLAFYTWKGYVRADEVSVKPVTDGVLGDEMTINGGFEEDAIQTNKTQYPVAWMNTYNGATADYAKVSYIKSTDMDAFEGNRSMLVQIPTETSNVQMDLTTHLSKRAENGKTYRLEYWTKTLSGTSHGSLRVGTADGTTTYSKNYIFGQSSTKNPDENGLSEKDGWVHRSHDFTMTSAAERVILRHWAAETAFYDNFKLREKKEDGTFGENLIPNGDMEAYTDFASTVADKTYNNTWKVWTMGVENPVSSDYLRFVEVADGDYAMYMKWDKYTADDLYSVVELTNSVTLPAGSYTLEYDSKMYWGSNTNPTLTVGPSLWSGSNRWAYNQPWKFATDYTAKNDGWMHVKKTFTVDSETTTTMRMLHNGYVDMLIDNISIKDVNGKEYIPDGDFSGTKEYNTTELYNLVAYNANAAGTATVSWINPHAEISDVVVNVNGEAIEATVDTTADAFNQVVLEGLTVGETYNIEVSATINGEVKTYTASIVATEAREWITAIDGLDADKWAAISRDGNGYANSKIEIASENDDNYVKVQGNIPSAPGTTYTGIQYSLTDLDQYYVYKLKFKVKGENVTKLGVMLESEDLGWTYESDVTEIASDWNTCEVWLDNYNDSNGDIYSADLQIISENFAGYFAIDDVELYAYESDFETEVDGVNLIENGVFDIAEPVMADPVLTLNGVTETTLKQGTMNVAVNVENIDDITLILALYKDNALQYASIMEKTTDGSEEGYETGLLVPDLSDGVYTAKVMYWKSFDNIEPLRGAFEITE